jgi:hypothetical protein
MPAPSPYVVDYADRIVSSARVDRIPFKLQPAEAASLASRYGVEVELPADGVVPLRDLATLIAAQILSKESSR